MDLADFLRSRDMKPADLAKELSCSKSYLSHVLATRKQLGKPTAVAIFNKYGAKVGPLADLTDEEIRWVERLHAKGAA